MKKFIVLGAALLVFLSFTGCGTNNSAEEHDDLLGVTGIVEVLHVGTRSESVIITDDESGEVFALVGEQAFDIVPEISRQTAVIGRLTDEGYSVREDLRKLYVIDFSALQEDDYEDY